MYGEGVSKLLEGVRSVSKRSIGSMGSDATHLEAMLVAPLTELSTAAHHLCDILHHLHQQEQSRHQQQQQRRRLTPQEAQSAEKKRVRYQKEQLALRTEVLELVLARVAQVKAEISLLGASAQHTEPEREPEPVWGSTERRKSALLVVLVQLMKRAAEAGNDVFGAAVLVSDKMRAAGTIFDLLEV